MPKFITPVEVTPAQDSVWNDVDITAHVGSDAGNVAMAILQCESSNSSLKNMGLRKNGSTDDRFTGLRQKGQTWHFPGVDGNDIFEAKVQDSFTHIWLLGYFTVAEAAAITNGVAHSLGSTGSWLDIDVTADVVTGTAIASMFQILSGSFDNYGLRQNGSTDDRYNQISQDNMQGGFIALDADEICEMKIGDLSIDIYHIGYVLSNLTDFLNAKAYATGTTGSYVDADLSSDIPSGNNSAAFQVFNPALAADLFAIRKNGGSFDEYHDVVTQGFMAIEIDASRIVEQKIQTTNLDLWLWGYMSEPVAAGGVIFRRRIEGY